MTRVHLSKPDITEVEEDFILDAVRSGWVAPLGPDVDQFEAEVAHRLGVGGALALSSGTAALHLALLLLGARPGTCVLVPTMTFAATPNAVTYTGATPVFVDSQTSDGNVDPDLLIEALDTIQGEGGTVSAVVAVDLYGRCVDYGRVTDPLRGRGVPLLEDAAESLGSSYQGQPAGSFGAAAALSFNGNKIMTTSGGGMLVSNDASLLDRGRYLSTQARQPAGWYEHTEIGYNYRLSNILAALGRAQLTRLSSMIERRQEIRARYVSALGGLPGVSFLPPDPTGTENTDNCWLSCIRWDRQRCRLTPTSLINILDAEDIEARRLWKPMHLQPSFASARSFTNGSAELLFETGLALPSGSALSDDQVDRVIEIVTAQLSGALR